LQQKWPARLGGDFRRIAAVAVEPGPLLEREADSGNTEPAEQSSEVLGPWAWRQSQPWEGLIGHWSQQSLVAVVIAVSATAAAVEGLAAAAAIAEAGHCP